METKEFDNIIKTPGLQHIAEKIFMNLDLKTLRICEHVSKNWKTILNNPWFWIKFCIQQGLQQVILSIHHYFEGSEIVSSDPAIPKADIQTLITNIGRHDILSSGIKLGQKSYSYITGNDNFCHCKTRGIGTGGMYVVKTNINSKYTK